MTLLATPLIDFRGKIMTGLNGGNRCGFWLYQVKGVFSEENSADSPITR